jgi:general secretion pathway protein D
MDEVLDAGIIDFQSADVNSVLEVYAEFVNRTVIRPAQLPGEQIILKTQTALSRQEIIHALDSVLQMNGITMIPVDEKFVKAVPNAQVLQEAAEFYGNDPAGLPETGTYVTHVARLKYAQPSEVQQILTQFAKVPNGILPVDSSQILVLRDYAANIKRMVEMIEKVDVITPQEFKHKVIPIKYALAEDIANVIGSLSTGGPMPLCPVKTSRSFSPLSALYAMNRPSGTT